MKSVFSWILPGNTGKYSESSSTIKSSSPQLLCICKVSDAGMSNFGTFETIGIKTSKECKEDIGNKVVAEFSDTINFMDGRYEAHLPWKEHTKIL